MIKKQEILEVLMNYLPPTEIEQFVENKEHFAAAIEDIVYRAREDEYYKSNILKFISMRIKWFKMKLTANIIK